MVKENLFLVSNNLYVKNKILQWNIDYHTYIKKTKLLIKNEKNSHNKKLDINR